MKQTTIFLLAIMMVLGSCKQNNGTKVLVVENESADYSVDEEQLGLVIDSLILGEYGTTFLDELAWAERMPMIDMDMEQAVRDSANRERNYTQRCAILMNLQRYLSLQVIDKQPLETLYPLEQALSAYLYYIINMNGGSGASGDECLVECELLKIRSLITDSYSEPCNTMAEAKAIFVERLTSRFSSTDSEETTTQSDPDEYESDDYYDERYENNLENAKEASVKLLAALDTWMKQQPATVGAQNVLLEYAKMLTTL